MYDYLSGERVAQAAGHGGVITGVIFLPDCKRLASVSFPSSSFFFLIHHVLEVVSLMLIHFVQLCPLSTSQRNLIIIKPLGNSKTGEIQIKN